MHCLFIAFALFAVSADAAEPVTMPQVVDPRLKIELFAAEPDIVTPTGLAVDGQGRVLVVESHTHFRPDDYAGPPADRVRMFVDADGDGRCDKVTTFFEGTTWTMNIGIHPDGSVYIATRDEIFRLRDTDGDGRADQRTPIAHLETQGAYPHNGLSGFAFDFDGNVYFGLGENKGAEFKLIGTDGSMASELEGGQVYRCRADGSHVEMLALGFWNPFHVCFDAFERLFAVDNDPDSLPPCRLMHIVNGGNYGYRYRNGRKGVHPFTAWNGELPGTLPMVAGTGEAPSGVLAYESDHLPADYVGDLLVTSWGDHRIDRFRLEPRGASLRGTPTPIVRGDENFRPVGIATAPDGSLFITDWVLKEYHVHGKGRLWHIRAADLKPAKRPSEPRDAVRAADRTTRETAARRLAADATAGRPYLEKLALHDPLSRVRSLAVQALASVNQCDCFVEIARRDAEPAVRALAIRKLPPKFAVDRPSLDALLAKDAPAEVRAAAMSGLADQADLPLLWNEVASADAFVAEAAREGLTRLRAVSVDDDMTDKPAAQRLAALLILRQSRDPKARRALDRFLRDPDSDVRFAAIQWVGEERLSEFREPLLAALSAGPATGRLFGGYLAALERLDGVQRESSDEWAGEQYMARALLDPATPPEARRWSLRMLRADHPVLTVERLRQFIEGDDPLLRLEAIRSLRESRHSQRGQLLAQIASDSKLPSDVRAEAIVGLSAEDPTTRALLLSLARSGDKALRNEALRSLRGATLSDVERDALKGIAAADRDAAEMFEKVLQPTASTTRPGADDVAGWLKLAGDGGGDPAAGERIFFHAKSAGCARCHQMYGRGARIGPELTATAGTLSRARLVESIVRPSQEIAPQFATWLVVSAAGTSMVGMLVKEEANGQQTYADLKGELTLFQPGEIEHRQAQSTSIMPQGLTQAMSVQEFRDLLAFLQAQRRTDGSP